MTTCCRFLTNNQCEISTRLAAIPVVTNPATCEACKQQVLPMSENPVTYGLAAVTLAKQGLYSTNKYPHIAKGLHTNFDSSTYNKPGTCLKHIFDECKVSSTAECGCTDYALKMDSWGTIGCTERRKEICEHLNVQQYNIVTAIKIAMKGYFSTMDIVDEAIKRSRQPN